MAVSIQPFPSDFGAHLVGIDLRDELSAADVDAIQAALVRYGFVLHHGATMTSDEQIRFTRRLGTPIADGREGKLFKIFDDRYRFSYWHCDGTFHAPPAMLSVQHMLVGGAETQVMNGYAALARMPPSLARQLETARASYHLHNARKVKVPPTNAPDAGPFPIAWRHPATDRRSLYLNLNCAKVVGMSAEDGERLLVEIEDHLRTLVGVAGVYQVIPSVAGNTLVVDNRAVLHCGPIDPASSPADRKIQWTGTVATVVP